MRFAWILVAESSRAKIFSLETRHSPLVESASFAHTSGRLHEGDLVTDRPGSDGGRAGYGRHLLRDKTSAHDATIDQFAKQLAEQVDDALRRSRFKQLVLIAPPQFLGRLRAHLSKNALAAVVEEIDKNLVRHTAAEVREHVSYLRPVRNSS